MGRKLLANAPTKRDVCLGCAVFSGLLFVVFGVLVVIYMQSLMDAYINKLLAFSEDSPTFQAWRDPPVAIKTKLFFFNLTNREEFLNGTAKPKLVEVGPYVLGEKWDRRNVSFYPNGTLSSQLYKVLRFIREESVGPESDLITTLNVPMVSAAHQARYQPLTMRLTTSSLLEVLEEYPVITRSVYDLVVGYRDPLLKLAKDIQPPGQSLPYESFGFFVGKNGSTDPPLLLNTGQWDWRKIGVIERYDGSRTLPFWNTHQCNMINGSDGAVYPPGATETSVVYLFARDLCRSMPLVFEKHVMHEGVKTLRFTPPQDVFGSVEEKPDNMCYCVGGPPCAPSGLFNVSVCQFGSPTFMSFPHFYLADESILDKVDGLSPSKEKHQFLIDIVPRVGVAMKAKIRVQINFHIGPVPDIQYTQTLPDMYYPVLWMEATYPTGHVLPCTVDGSGKYRLPCICLSPYQTNPTGHVLPGTVDGSGGGQAARGDGAHGEAGHRHAGGGQDHHDGRLLRPRLRPPPAGTGRAGGAAAAGAARPENRPNQRRRQRQRAEGEAAAAAAE